MREKCRKNIYCELNQKNTMYDGELVKVRCKVNLILKPRKGKPLVDIAVDHMLSSPATANKIYRKAFEKRRKDLLMSGIVETNIPLKNIWNL